MQATIITIDGAAATGKSSVGKLLATSLDYSYFDTGLLYRALTWYLLKENKAFDEKSIEASLPSFATIRWQTTESKELIYLLADHQLSPSILHSAKINEYVAQVSVLPAVRKALQHIQKEQASAGYAVFVGRDLGVSIFPNALVKIYLSADLSLRAERRLKELGVKDKEEVLQSLAKRDQIDSTRVHSPLTKAWDAYHIDTSKISVQQTVDQILMYREKRLRSR